MHIHGGNIYKNKVKADFSANLNLLGMPESVQKAAIEGVLASQVYPDPDCTLLREKLALLHQIPMDQILCGNGAAELIFALVAEVKPQKALIVAPSFFEYTQALNYVHCEITEYFLKKEHQFCIQEDFLDWIKPELDLVFLCNPNNPTGQLIDPILLEKIVTKATKMNCLCVIDECFLSFVDEKDQYSCSSLIKNNSICILKAFTKIYAMPGIRLGYLIASDQKLLSNMKNGIQPWSVSVVAQKAGVAALDEVEYLNETLNQLKSEKDFLLEQLHLLDYEVYGSAANFIFFKGETNLFQQLLSEGIMIRDCSNFSGLEQGYFRIAVRTRQENCLLIETIRRIRHG